MSGVALLHYWLTNMRGGENVLNEICTLFTEADLFTHAFNPDKITGAIKKRHIYETFIARLPGARTNPQRYLPLMPLALRQLDVSAYDLLISSESGPAKGICKRPGAVHLCYCHTPMRYLWDMYEQYYAAATPLAQLAMRLCKNRLRRYDLTSAESVDHFMANSQFIAERIKRIYGRESTVVYPPVDTEFYTRAKVEKRDYYLFVGELIGYKRPDLAIAACRRMKRKLVIVGRGSLRARLEQEAGGDGLIRFAERVSNEELRDLYAGARALIFPGIEDFGIVPLEAQATGTPVIALGRGGALETIIEGKTGLFFATEECEALCAAIEDFEGHNWDAVACRAQADSFSVERFHREFLTVVRKHTAGTPAAAILPVQPVATK